MDVDRHGDGGQDLGHALDRVSHHRAAHMVWVMVGHEDAGETEIVGREHRKEIGDAVGRVDEHRLSGFAISDGVHVVDHLAGQRVVGGEVTS